MGCVGSLDLRVIFPSFVVIHLFCTRTPYRHHTLVSEAVIGARNFTASSLVNIICQRRWLKRRHIHWASRQTGVFGRAGCSLVISFVVTLSR